MKEENSYILYYKMLNFVNACPIFHMTIVVDRKEASDKIALSGKLAKAINTAMSVHQDFFASFEKIIVYYDNGQNELSSILNAVFSVLFSNVELVEIFSKSLKYIVLNVLAVGSDALT